jgi:drug/metabolite transporter (DMT)-like permease
MADEVVKVDFSYARMAKVIGMCFMYIVISGGLINFNKYLMQKGHFPHSMQLTACHMIGSIFLASLGYLIFPSMFPGMERTRGKKLQVYKWLVPIGCLFAIMLYGSNRAYMYCSVAFLQFMKEANVVLVFTFSCIVGLQQMNRQRLFVIAWVILGGSLCVSGELHFAVIGFVCQLFAQLAECARVVAAEIVLNGDLKLDPLTYTLLVAPVCLVVLVIGSIITWTPAVAHDFAQTWPLIIPNACLAFILNVWIALVIKETSAVGFIVTGIIKDIVLVVFSSILFHDAISAKQWGCFAITISGVFFWSFMKVRPEHPIVKTFDKMLGARPWDESLKATEETPLVPGDKKV